MALVTESFNGDGVTETFTVSNEVLSKSHVRVHYYYDLLDHEVSFDDWDLLGKGTIVFIDAPTSGYIVKITTSTDGTGLGTLPSDLNTLTALTSDISIVADIASNVTIVANDLAGVDNIGTVVDSLPLLNAVNNNKVNVDKVAVDIAKVNTVSSNIADVNTAADNIANLNIDAANIGSINVVANAIQTGTPIGGGSGGQYHGNGIVKGIEYFAQAGVTTDDIVIASGTNAMSVDSFTIADGSSITIQDNAVYKVI